MSSPDGLDRRVSRKEEPRSDPKCLVSELCIVLRREYKASLLVTFSEVLRVFK